jgi:chromosome segregation ATPase
MVRGKGKNISNSNQGYLTSSEPSSPTTASPGYSNTPEKEDYDLKSHLMMMIEDFKKDINNSLKEIQENTTKHVKELSKTIQDLKMEIETIKKSQRETTLDIGNLGNRSGVIDASITNRIQEIEERISGAEDTIENIDTTVKENAKCKKLLTQNIQEIQDTMRRANQRILGIEESEDSQLKGPVNIFNKIIEENFSNLKKEMPMNIQGGHRTRNRLDPKRNSSHHIIVKTPNAQNKEKILKAIREKGQVTYKGRRIRIIPDFSSETMKARRFWADVMQTLREHKCQPRLLYPAKLSKP